MISIMDLVGAFIELDIMENIKEKSLIEWEAPNWSNAYDVRDKLSDYCYYNNEVIWP